MTDTLKVTRRRLTVADRLKDLDELTTRESDRLTKKVSDAEDYLNAAEKERTDRLAELATKRAAIVDDAKRQAAALLEQIEAKL